MVTYHNETLAVWSKCRKLMAMPALTSTAVNPRMPVSMLFLICSTEVYTRHRVQPVSQLWASNTCLLGCHHERQLGALAQI